jgi:Zn-dependent alcohol dehydrogenase
VARAREGRKGGPARFNFPVAQSGDLAQHRRFRFRDLIPCASKPPSFASLASSRPTPIRSRSKSPNSTLATPGRGELLVKIAAAGLCHSDLSVIDGSRPRPTPMALGHEAAAVVEQVGEGVTDLKAGDHVVLVFVPSCGRCGPCAAGRPALCEPAAKANAAGTLLSGERRLSFEARPINHLLGVSAFATHAVVARESCVKIDPDLPLELAALFGCAVLTGVGAVVNTAKVEPGQSVAVVGLYQVPESLTPAGIPESV